jgi:hypothetical protein
MSRSPLSVVAGLTLLASVAAAQTADDVKARAQQALTRLQQAGRAARAAPSPAEREAIAAACDAACEDYAWVLEHLDAVAPQLRAELTQLALYNSACARSLQGQVDEGLRLLALAVREGFTDARAIEGDEDLAALRRSPRFDELVASARLAKGTNDLYVLTFQADQAESRARRALARDDSATAEAELDRACQLWELALPALELLYVRPSSVARAQAELRHRLLRARTLQRRHDAALEHLEAAVATGLQDPRQLLVDRDLLPMVRDERFLALVRRAKRSWDARQVPDPLPVELTWTFADALSREDLQAYAVVVQSWANTLWTVSEGTVFLQRVALRDRATQAGDLHTPHGLATSAMLIEDQTYGMHLLGVVYLPGYCNPVTFVHELGHRLFGLPDEYGTADGCPCVMAGEKGVLAWCDADSHTAGHVQAGKTSCWERVARWLPEATKRAGVERPPVTVELPEAD